MLKKFTLVMAALVGAALVLIGCPTEAETETKYVTQTDMIHLDVFAADITKLAEYLAAPGDLSIGLSESATLTDDLTIPAGKLVYILNGGSLATSSTYKLTVEGKVYVGVRGTLTATAAAPVEVTTGSVGVVKGGTLSIDTALAVTNGATPAATALGSAKAVLAAESKLEVSVALANAAELTAALGYVGTGGTLKADVTDSKPSDFQALDLGGKKLITTALADETSSTLTVPAGLTLTAKSSDTLATITGLTVNGSLAASSATFTALTTLAVNGDLIVPGGAAAKVAPATGTGNITVSTAASLSAAVTFSFPGVITFGDTFATSASSPGVVFNGTVVFGGNVTLTAAPVTFGGTAFFADEAVVTLTTAASIITLKDGAGALAAGVPVDNVPDIYHKVIQADAGNDVTLIPVADTTLTFTENGGITQGAVGNNAHGITIGKAARLIPGAAYTVASASGKIGTLTVDTGSTLTIGAGALANESFGGVPSVSARLVLTGAATANGALLKGAGSVVAGGTTIVGGTNGWQAVDDGTDAYTIEANAITAADGGGAFTAVTGATQPSITVAAGATLNLAADTTIDLKGITTTVVGSLVLKNTAVVEFAKGTTTIVKTANSSNDAFASITSLTIGDQLTTSETSGHLFVSFTAKDADPAADRRITATADVTLDSNTTTSD